MLAIIAVAQATAAQTPPGSMPAMPAMPVPEPTPAVAAPAAPATAAPAVALPEVNVPTVDVPADVPIGADVLLGDVPQSAPALPAVADEEVADAAPVTEAPLYDAQGEAFSYGTSDLSLLFTPSQVSRMKSVLSVYETARRNRTDTTIEVVEDIGPEDVEPVLVKEPASYPVFTLKSIAYSNARDWTVWIGDLRITPRKNEQEIRVLAVNRTMAQLLWKPPYREALQQRGNMKLFASTDAVKHKMTRPNTAVFDTAAGQVTFTLRPNQSFAPGYMATFEGKIPAPELPKMDSVEEESEALPATPAAGDTSAANPNNLDALLKAQQQPAASSLFRRALTTEAPTAETAPAPPAAAPAPAPAPAPASMPVTPIN